ncbi:hypothetical protein Leryth_009295 [Lithospermum erythrorhizon]|nr:hypothetical protein Leryth_009295 [Lithospermum erythrorhizon]
MAHCFCFGKQKGKNVKKTRDKENQYNKSSKARQMASAQESFKSETKLDNEVEAVDDHVKARVFSYRELASATNNFREESLIGEGGFGPVYKGVLERTGQAIAVKTLNHAGLQGDKEFLVEVLMLNLLRHENLVNLIGYCAEGQQRLLVYEYLSAGSLEYHLHDLTTDMEPLDWNTRMVVALGAAKGLNYLHNEAKPPVIYRDLKSSNILLDENFQPKLSDFGLAKFGPGADKSHVSTRVMGTHGYCAPEYAGTGRLTVKSDIYSFGIVLLEIITGRRALDPTRPRREQILLDWARPFLRERNYVQLADPKLKGQFSGSSLQQVIGVVLTCLRDDHHKRPDANEVVVALNYVATQKYDMHSAHLSTSRHGKDLTGPAPKGVEEKGRTRSKTEGDEGSVGKERERAVAEAKMWGETWREKRREASEGGESENLNLN